VGLTGGIGSGKSTVAAGLARRGAGVVDADAIAREILEPEGAAYQQVVDHFGTGIVAPDGRIDRRALARAAFQDPEALDALNRLTHPVIGAIMAERMDEAAADHDVVVLDIPLLTIATKDRFQFGAIVVVDTPEDVAVARLMEQRGFTEADAWARVRAQISREERRGLADQVLDNRAGREVLEGEIDRLWAWLQDRAATAGAGADSTGPGVAGADSTGPEVAGPGEARAELAGTGRSPIDATGTDGAASSD
jgi:dephospho-CoA kinase